LYLLNLKKDYNMPLTLNPNQPHTTQPQNKRDRKDIQSVSPNTSKRLKTKYLDSKGKSQIINNNGAYSLGLHSKGKPDSFKAELLQAIKEVQKAGGTELTVLADTNMSFGNQIKALEELANEGMINGLEVGLPSKIISKERSEKSQQQLQKAGIVAAEEKDVTFKIYIPNETETASQPRDINFVKRAFMDARLMRIYALMAKAPKDLQSELMYPDNIEHKNLRGMLKVKGTLDSDPNEGFTLNEIEEKLARVKFPYDILTDHFPVTPIPGNEAGAYIAAVNIIKETPVDMGRYLTDSSPESLSRYFQATHKAGFAIARTLMTSLEALKDNPYLKNMPSDIIEKATALAEVDIDAEIGKGTILGHYANDVMKVFDQFTKAVQDQYKAEDNNGLDFIKNVLMPKIIEQHFAADETKTFYAFHKPKYSAFDETGQLKEGVKKGFEKFLLNPHVILHRVGEQSIDRSGNKVLLKPSLAKIILGTLAVGVDPVELDQKLPSAGEDFKWPSYSSEREDASYAPRDNLMPLGGSKEGTKDGNFFPSYIPATTGGFDLPESQIKALDELQKKDPENGVQIFCEMRNMEQAITTLRTIIADWLVKKQNSPEEQGPELHLEIMEAPDVPDTTWAFLSAIVDKVNENGGNNDFVEALKTEILGVPENEMSNDLKRLLNGPGGQSTRDLYKLYFLGKNYPGKTHVLRNAYKVAMKDRMSGDLIEEIVAAHEKYFPDDKRMTVGGYIPQ
ncbi:MAG: hypothetical protein AAF621_06575, partial [Pseudomonadota bacterium]